MWKYVLLGTGLAVTLVGIGLAVAHAARLEIFWPFMNQANSLRLAGVVEIQEVKLGSKVGGRVDWADTEAEGHVVPAGQVLVRLAEPELESQREQAQARYQEAQANLIKVNANLQRAKSDLQQWQAKHVQAKRYYERIRDLGPSGALSQADVDAALAAYETSQATLAVGNDAVAQAESDIEVAKAQIAEGLGALHEKEANLKEAVVSAPEEVIVDVLAVRKGDLVQPNQILVYVLRTADVRVKAFVPETELGKVRLDQPVEVTIDSYPGRVFPGTVKQILSESEFTPRNIQSVDERHHQVFGIRVFVPQPDDPKERILKSGMAAEVTLHF